MIFLSYSRGDAQQADDWLRNLEQYGYRVWIDRESIRGGLWMRTIVRSIREAQAVILLLSPNSAQSDNVRRE
ncbi:MAG: toll/interleukin-1 receptor domain-containing protein, partial [Gammaproteobacteria bacterium]